MISYTAEQGTDRVLGSISLTTAVKRVCTLIAIETVAMIKTFVHVHVSWDNCPVDK